MLRDGPGGFQTFESRLLAMSANPLVAPRACPSKAEIAEIYHPPCST